MNPKPPLYLPKGSVRSILAIMLTVVTCVGFLAGMIPSDKFLELALLALGFYFIDRSNSAK